MFTSPIKLWTVHSTLTSSRAPWLRVRFRATWWKVEARLVASLFWSRARPLCRTILPPTCSSELGRTVRDEQGASNVVNEPLRNGPISTGTGRCHLGYWLHCHCACRAARELVGRDSHAIAAAGRAAPTSGVILGRVVEKAPQAGLAHRFTSARSP